MINIFYCLNNLGNSEFFCKYVFLEGKFFKGILLSYLMIENVLNYGFLRKVMEDTFPKSSRKVTVNPVIVELEDNWDKYGFKDKEEAELYTLWIMWPPKGDIGGENFGFKGCNAPEDIINRYPIKDFRKSRKQLDENIS